MTTVERLNRDHELLREKVRLLRIGLSMVPESWSELRLACSTLTRWLDDHVEREVDAIAGYYRAHLDRCAVDHYAILRSLRVLSQYFAEGAGSHRLNRVRRILPPLLDRLCRQMDVQEERLFPMIAKPHTPVFAIADAEELAPSLAQTHSFNEMPWGHGISSYELVEQLAHQIR